MRTHAYMHAEHYIRQKRVQTVIGCCQIGSRVAAPATTRAAPCLSRQTFSADCQSALDTLIPCPRRRRHPATSASSSVAAAGPLSVGATLQAAASSVGQASQPPPLTWTARSRSPACYLPCAWRQKGGKFPGTRRLPHSQCRARQRSRDARCCHQSEACRPR